MRHKRATRYVLVLTFAIVAPIVLLGSLPAAHALGGYTLYVLYPGHAQEGGTNAFQMTVTGANATTYRFQFTVQDPQSKPFKSILYNYTNPPGQTTFNLPVVIYPSPGFQGPTSLVGTYHLSADQIAPVFKANIASNSFDFILTNTYFYARTQTVMIQATGYNASESVNVGIRPVGSTNVFTQNPMASASGVVATSWRIPWNATLGYYIVQVTGTTTVKNPADLQAILIGSAPVAISGFASSKSTYQRTETMQFSFQAVYLDNSNATTGAGTIQLTRPNGSKFNITATYSATARLFLANYKTSSSDITGTWNATMGINWFDDSAGNTGPSQPTTTFPQLTAATLTINANVTTYVAVGQSLNLNATVTYPDGSALQSGAAAYLLHSGSPFANRTVSITFDSGLQRWLGSYTLQSIDPGGLWTLVIRASDSSTPTDTGSASKAVTTQDHPPVASFNPSTSSAPTGTPIGFDGTASYDPDGSVVTWSWTFGDGNSGSGSTTTHTYSTAGAHTITLTVTDNSGSTGSTTYQVTITDRPPTASFAPSPLSAPTGTSISFNGAASSDPDGTVVTWSWAFGDGTSGLGSTTTHSYSTAGTFTVALTVTDNSGSTATTTSQVTITDRPPVVSFNASPTNPTSGQRVTLSITASDPDGSVTSIRVDWGDGTVDSVSGNTTSDSHTYTSTSSAAKAYTITVTATDSGSQTGTPATSTVSVQPTSTGGNGNISLPLYYFGILAAAIAAMLIGGFVAFRRHRVTHANLKIDLEAVKSEAGRIENQEFFQSVKDQLKKDKDD